MTEKIIHQRMLDKEKKPSTKEIYEYIGKNTKKAWKELSKFMETNYDIEPETVFYGKNYGWLVRYRKSNRTLCSFFPERNSFTFLITYGKKEVEKFNENKDQFNSKVVKIFDKTKQLHDGKWLYIRLTDASLLDDVKNLIVIKRKPKKK